MKKFIKEYLYYIIGTTIIIIAIILLKYTEFYCKDPLLSVLFLLGFISIMYGTKTKDDIIDIKQNPPDWWRFLLFLNWNKRRKN